MAAQLERDTYFTIEKTARAEFKDRGSKFIAHAYPVKTAAAVKQCLQELKKAHPKATHHCFAYRLGTDGRQFRVNDDGEPSGAAGRPILNQIDSKQLTNVLVAVVRYFGGSLLGLPGLIHAYKTATTLVLQLTPLVEKNVEANYLLHFDYTIMNEAMTVLRKFQCSILSRELQLFCTMQIGIPMAKLEACLEQLNNIRGLEFSKLP